MRERERECATDVTVRRCIYADFKRNVCDYFCYPIPAPSLCFCKALRAFKDRRVKITISIIIINIGRISIAYQACKWKYLHSLRFRLTCAFASVSFQG